MPIELVNPNTRIDFLSKRQIAGAMSAALLLAGLVAVFVRGVQLGIDFAGGTEIQVRFDATTAADEGSIRAVVGEMDGVEGLSVVRFGDENENEFLVKFQATEIEAPAASEVDVGVTETVEAELEETADAESEEGTEVDVEISAADDQPVADLVEQIAAALAAGIGEPEIQRVEFVGPRVGAELRDDGLKALLFASIFILAYIAFRFSTRFAPGAIVAVLHDLLITAGIFVILGMEFDLRILAAMLAILGYSLNDTIIIYDRIRENMELRTKVDLPEVLNESVNQTLSRTVLTSGTTLLALGSLFFLGGEVIRPFAFAMLVGVLVGTYSSIYIAAPTLLFLETRYGGAGAGKPA